MSEREERRRRGGGAGEPNASPPSPPPEEQNRHSRRKKRERSKNSEPEERDHHNDSSRRRKRRRRRRQRDKDPHHRRRSLSRASSDEQSNLELTPRRGIVSVDEDGGARTSGRAARPKERSPSSHDDTTGHFRGGSGAVIADRYRVIKEVGIGTFGRVVECLDLKARARGQRRDEYVAVKVVRNVKRYYDSAVIEARIVQDVNRRGGRGLSHVVVLHNAFTFAGHFCMVFESLGPSLYDFLKRHKYRPFPMVCIQDFTIQLLETLEFLHSFRLIHTDLKIENVLLMNDREVTYGNQRVPESTRIKVIDFGGACYDSDKKSSVINTRQYRAPEVILGTGWSMPSDIWSAGCILAELYIGELLFATHNNIEHLALIERTIGYFPREMLRKARSCSPIANEAFDSRDVHRREDILSPESASYVEKALPLSGIVTEQGDLWFLDLLRRMLVIDPYDRATAHECLQFLRRIRKDVVRHC